MADVPESSELSTPRFTGRSAAIILVGDELLSGKIRDRNGVLLIRELRERGIDVTELHVVADITERIVEAIQLVCSRNDFVFTSGGIGPTHDDKTMGAVAAAFGTELERRDDLVEVIQKRFGDDPDNPWLKMADIPRDCELYFHEGMRWPIFKMHNVFVLPGIPEVFEQQFDWLKARLKSDSDIHLRTIYLVPHEGVVAAVLNRLDDRFPSVDFGSYPVLDAPDYSVRVTIEGRIAEDVEAASEAVLAGFSKEDVVRVVA